MKKFHSYQKVEEQTPESQVTWPLYGSGVESLGKNGKPVTLKIPKYSESELLMRIDAISLCYTDLKEIDQGPNHPRLTGRDLANDPIIPGHEVSMTVAGVGEKLTGSYKIGDRFTLQPDVWVDGKSIPFCFGMDGGYRQYAIIGKEILEGDAGNYLIPVPDEMSYAASAITEPWACVEAAYRTKYRSGLKQCGRLWVIGGETLRSGYKADELLDSSNLTEIVVTNPPIELENELKVYSEKHHVKFSNITWEEISKTDTQFDDIWGLDCTPEVINCASKKIGQSGILAIYHSDTDGGKIEIDLGRLHYDMIYFVGSTALNLADAYHRTDPRAEFVPEGIAWILGAGGPMGRMHLQRAIESQHGPRLIVASEVTEDRFTSLNDFFMPMANQHHKELLIVNPKTEPEKYSQIIETVMSKGGFDDIEVMVAVEPVIVDSIKYIAKKGVINLFAGLKRGITGLFDANLIYGEKQARFIGHSGSDLDDQKAVVDRAISKNLRPELSVAAIGGVNQIADGIRAMKNWVYPGKIVIYPHVIDYPLTGLDELAAKEPEVGKVLGENATWTKEAESIFLDQRLS
jgi:threonine dehydrogenase-like Zn-dependent dehydrogenase